MRVLLFFLAIATTSASGESSNQPRMRYAWVSNGHIFGKTGEWKVVGYYYKHQEPDQKPAQPCTYTKTGRWSPWDPPDFTVDYDHSKWPKGCPPGYSRSYDVPTAELPPPPRPAPPGPAWMYVWHDVPGEDNGGHWQRRPGLGPSAGDAAAPTAAEAGLTGPPAGSRYR